MKRISIVTGASSGLGREFALQLAKKRTADEIWLIARRMDRLEDILKEFETSGPKPRAIALDLSGKQGVDAVAALLEKEKTALGTEGLVIDALVNNAGFGTYGTFRETDRNRQLEMIDLNSVSLTGLCHVAVPLMTAGSVIINVASLAAFAALGNFAVYAATKSYVMRFSVALSAELEDTGIFVETVCPGPVDTEFANVASRGAREKVVDGKKPSAVVAHCLKNIRKGKRVSVMALKWKFKAFMSRFVDPYSFARWTYLHEKRPSK